jgi:oligopeptide/dipeptide ABC transporter ATP-binding protein
MAEPPHLLEVKDLAVEFHTAQGTVHALAGVSYHLDRGETLALLGESGSGKSVSASAIMNILDTPPGYITGGQILLEGKDLLKMSAAERRRINGERIAIIFQDPLAHLNPVHTVGFQIEEALRAHQSIGRRAAKERAITLLEHVGIPDPARRVDDYPHQFSGGQRQRVMIAMALALRPDVLIADEPTTALDVTVQAQILELLKQLQAETGMGLLLITHDLGVVAETATHVLVMYAGRAMEYGPAAEIFNGAQHPYTWGLLESMPTVVKRLETLVAIEGSPPSLLAPPPGCAFHPRCKYRFSPCDVERPPLVPMPDGHLDACHLPAARKREVWVTRVGAQVGLVG